MEDQMIGMDLGGMTSPDQIQQQVNMLSNDEVAMARQSLMEIKQVIEMLMEQGVSEQEIIELLEQMGITMEELALAEEMLMSAEAGVQM